MVVAASVPQVCLENQLLQLFFNAIKAFWSLYYFLGFFPLYQNSSNLISMLRKALIERSFPLYLVFAFSKRGLVLPTRNDVVVCKLLPRPLGHAFRVNSCLNKVYKRCYDRFPLQQKMKVQSFYFIRVFSYLFFSIITPSSLLFLSYFLSFRISFSFFFSLFLSFPFFLLIFSTLLPSYYQSSRSSGEPFYK